MFPNPYRPGAGHAPPHLAGRAREFGKFERLLAQDTVLENIVLAGLPGVGKTVLLDAFKPRALAGGWLWAGTDLSESASVSEEAMATRLLADLAVATSAVTIQDPKPTSLIPEDDDPRTRVPLSHRALRAIYDAESGLVSDKLRTVLMFAWRHLRGAGKERVIFAYDEAQNLSDNKAHNEYPLSVLLDVFQSIQKRGVPFLLILAGPPTLHPKLVDARAFADRMFHVLTLDRLDAADSREAISKPFQVEACPISFGEDSVRVIAEQSDGYPYFIQFMCREAFDVFSQWPAPAVAAAPASIEAILHKLDTDFFADRWARLTARQRELLWVIASLDRVNGDFTIHEIVERCKEHLPKPFSPSHVNQMLVSLSGQGLVYKNRFGRYSFAVPLLDKFILRTYDPPQLPVLHVSS